MKHLGVATTVQELMNLLNPYRDYLIYVEQPCGGYNACVSVDEENKIPFTTIGVAPSWIVGSNKT